MFYPRKTKINIKKTKRKMNKNWCWRRRDPMGIFVLVGSKCPQQRVDAIKWGPKTLRASASGGALRCLLRNTVNFSTSAPGWEAFNFSLLSKRSHYQKFYFGTILKCQKCKQTRLPQTNRFKMSIFSPPHDKSENKHIFQLNKVTRINFPWNFEILRLIL